jgi:hypothetical protein
MEKLELVRREDGRLVMKAPNDKGEIVDSPVQIACCFPWSRGAEYISVRDDKGRELRLIEKLDMLETPQRRLVEEELSLRNFMPCVTSIDSITDELELFHWQVQTTVGPRGFLTNRGDYPRVLPNGHVLIKDVCNDQYVIPDPKKLDARSMKLLWVYLD